MLLSIKSSSRITISEGKCVSQAREWLPLPSVISHFILCLICVPGLHAIDCFAADTQVSQTHPLPPNQFEVNGTVLAPNQTLMPVSATVPEIYPAATAASLPSTAMATSNTLAPSAHLQAPEPMNGMTPNQPPPFIYSNADLCGLQALLVTEAMQQDRIKPNMTFDRFNIDVIHRYFDSRVLDNLSDDRKVYFINLIHSNAQTAYVQGWQTLPQKTSRQRDDKLKHLMWQQCNTDLSHP